MLELPNFGHMIVFTMDRNYDVKTFISKHLYFKKTYSNHFCWHHENCNHVFQNYT